MFSSGAQDTEEVVAGEQVFFCFFDRKGGGGSYPSPRQFSECLGAKILATSYRSAEARSRQKCRKSASVGHPQTCVYPNACLGIVHVSGKVPKHTSGVNTGLGVPSSESAGPKRGAKESAEKVLRPSSLCIICIAYTEARRPKHFFGTFLGTRFGAGTFQSTFSSLLSGRGFGWSPGL